MEISTASYDRCIAYLEGPLEIQMANARLIAAAPELLDACKMLLELIDLQSKVGLYHRGFFKPSEVKEAQEVIAKATT